MQAVAAAMRVSRWTGDHTSVIELDAATSTGLSFMSTNASIASVYPGLGAVAHTSGTVSFTGKQAVAAPFDLLLNELRVLFYSVRRFRKEPSPLCIFTYNIHSLSSHTTPTYSQHKQTNLSPS